MSIQTHTAALCAAQLDRWPAAEAQDLVKALYQAEFGCGHLLSNPEQARRWLAEELSGAALPESGVCPPLAESLGHFSRVHLLPARQLGLSADTLYALFALTAGETTGCMEDFQQQLTALEALAGTASLPFSPDALQAYLNPYRAQGCPPARHSESFRAAHAPAYRIIRTEYVPFLPLLAAIDQRWPSPVPLPWPSRAAAPRASPPWAHCCSKCTAARSSIGTISSCSLTSARRNALPSPAAMWITSGSWPR